MLRIGIKRKKRYKETDYSLKAKQDLWQKNIGVERYI